MGLVLEGAYLGIDVWGWYNMGIFGIFGVGWRILCAGSSYGVCGVLRLGVVFSGVLVLRWFRLGICVLTEG